MPARTTGRRAKAVHATETTPRHLWLAVLGLAAVARREAPHAVSAAMAEAARLRQGAVRAASDTRDLARGIAITLQEVVAARFASGPAARRPAARKAPRESVRSPGRRSAAGRRKADVRIARKGRGSAS